MSLHPKQAILLYAFQYQHITLPIFSSINNNHVLGTALGSGQNHALQSIKIYYISTHLWWYLCVKTLPNFLRGRGVIILQFYSGFCIFQLFMFTSLPPAIQVLCCSSTSLTPNRVLGLRNAFNLKSTMNEWMVQLIEMHTQISEQKKFSNSD